MLLSDNNSCSEVLVQEILSFSSSVWFSVSLPVVIGNADSPLIWYQMHTCVWYPVVLLSEIFSIIPLSLINSVSVLLLYIATGFPYKAVITFHKCIYR